ncbi:hypothetical protein DRQ50_14670 [bacterium]|nr:MAG: hypothetical protein DRQ50_14670 [bacterium]
MQKQNLTPDRERKLKFAEAGILFVLLLGVTIFIGVRFQGGGEEINPTVAEITAPQEIVTEPVIETEPTVVIIDEPVIEIAPEPEPVTYVQAETAYHDGAYDEAIDLFERYVADHPDNVWGMYMLGMSAWKAGDLETADEALADARTMQPAHLKSVINHTRVLLAMDRDADAREAVTIALDLAPGDVGAQRLQARLYHRAGVLDQAAASYESILRTSSDDVWALNNLGLIRIEQERFDEALPALARAAGLTDAACIHNNLGVALERTGWYAQAAEAYEAALSRDADHARATVSLARVAELHGDPDRQPLDLVALAAGFGVDPAPRQEGDLVLGDLAVAVVTNPEQDDADLSVASETSTDDEEENR